MAGAPHLARSAIARPPRGGGSLTTSPGKIRSASDSTSGHAPSRLRSLTTETTSVVEWHRGDTYPGKVLAYLEDNERGLDGPPHRQDPGPLDRISPRHVEGGAPVAMSGSSSEMSVRSLSVSPPTDKTVSPLVSLGAASLFR